MDGVRTEIWEQTNYLNPARGIARPRAARAALRPSSPTRARPLAWQADTFGASDDALVRVWWSIKTGPHDSSVETKGYTNFTAATPPAAAFGVPAECREQRTACQGAERLPPRAALHHSCALRSAGLGRRSAVARARWRRWCRVAPNV